MEPLPAATTLRLDMDPRGVAVLELNRPRVGNAFDDTLISELDGAIRHLQSDPGVGLVILRAAGRHFCTGADLGWMQRSASLTRQQNIADGQRLALTLQRLNRLRPPVVARVQGAVYGGGLGLVACCDMVLAASSARFCLSEVRLGLVPAVISPYVMRAIGQRQARRYMLSAEIFDAQRAKDLHLVHEVCEEDQLDARLESLVSTLLENGPEAMANTKDLIFAVADRPLDRALAEDTAQRIAEARAGEEGREGMAAFFAKRPPKWRT